MYILLLQYQKRLFPRVVRKSLPLKIAFPLKIKSIIIPGVYYEPLCNPDARDHAMLLIGYGTDPSDGDFWTIKNRFAIGMMFIQSFF